MAAEPCKIHAVIYSNGHDRNWAIRLPSINLSEQTLKTCFGT